MIISGRESMEEWFAGSVGRELDRLIVNMISSSQKNREIVLARGKEFRKSINHVIE